MKLLQKNKQAIAILIVIIVGVMLAMLILGTDKNTAMDHEHEHMENVAISGVETKPNPGEQDHDHETKHPTSLDNENTSHSEHEHTAFPQEIIKGPHGGKLFTQEGYGLEVIIFEQNVQPEFRVYTYQNGKALDPESSIVSIQLDRLGRKPKLYKFAKENNYLKGDGIVEEPHSFNVSITAKHNNQAHQFSYDQVEARVQLSDKQLMHNNIEVLTAGPASIKSVLDLQGEVKRNADKSVQIVSRVNGFVESASVSAGDKVRKGQILASVTSQSIADMRSELHAAQKRLHFAQQTYAREKQLWEDKISAKQDYLQAKNDLHEAEISARQLRQRLTAIGANISSKNLALYQIRSPIDGIVTNKKVSQGQVLDEMDSLYEISDLSTVWVEIMVYAKDINIVKVGQKVSISSTSFTAETAGVIAYVSSLVGTQSRTAMARVVIDNSDRTWLPGLPVKVNVISDQVDVPLAVSLEGIQTYRDKTVVFGRYGEYFEARPLVLGRRDDKYVEVLEGIQAGENYAAENSFLIKADIGKAGASHDH